MLHQSKSNLYVKYGEDNKKAHYVAGFDLDWTLVRTRRGRFPKDEDDWAWLPNRLDVLNHYYHGGYTIVIFTNQNYKGEKLTIALNRINKIVSDLEIHGINVWAFVSTSKDKYRKPETGMWEELENQIKVIRSKSLYVGDAAGRETDHGNSDREFVENLNRQVSVEGQRTEIKFYTPEEIFPVNQVYIPKEQTLIVMVGMPGAGKSTFVKEKLQSSDDLNQQWYHVEQDVMKTERKILSAVKSGLINGKSVVVDATNSSLSRRKKYIELAKELNVPSMILYFVANGYERNKLREKPVPTVAYNVYYKKLEEPSYETDGVHVFEII